MKRKHLLSDHRKSNLIQQRCRSLVEQCCNRRSNLCGESDSNRINHKYGRRISLVLFSIKGGPVCTINQNLLNCSPQFKRIFSFLLALSTVANNLWLRVNISIKSQISYRAFHFSQLRFNEEYKRAWFCEFLFLVF